MTVSAGKWLADSAQIRGVSITCSTGHSYLHHKNPLTFPISGIRNIAHHCHCGIRLLVRVCVGDRMHLMNQICKIRCSRHLALLRRPIWGGADLCSCMKLRSQSQRRWAVSSWSASARSRPRCRCGTLCADAILIWWCLSHVWTARCCRPASHAWSA